MEYGSIVGKKAVKMEFANRNFEFSVNFCNGSKLFEFFKNNLKSVMCPLRKVFLKINNLRLKISNQR